MHPLGKGFMIATAVATLALGGELTALAQDKTKAEPLKCAGLNDCKGKGACKSVLNDCKGKKRLGRQILLENVSSYLVFTHSTLTEWEFLAAVAEEADCGILLDVNNVYVSAMNHGFVAETYLAGLPGDRIGQIHLAGHTDMGAYLFDTHDGPVIDPVWDLYRTALRRFGRISTLVEWDDHVPELDVVCAEADRARAIEAEVLSAVHAPTA